MMTAQDIREKTFEKAVFGGYDMAGVDAALEEIANDMAALQKENSVLKGKMKVLVGKIEEYRSNEDALRMAILSAQKMGNMIEKEAREKSEKMVNDAIEDAAQVTREAELEVEMEKARLAEAKRSSVQFIENMELLCRKQLDFVNKLKEADFVKEMTAEKQAAVPAAPAKPAAVPVEEEDDAEMHETVKSIEETVAKAVREFAGEVRPDIRGMKASLSNEDATRAFDIVSAGLDAEDVSLEKTTQFSLDSFLEK